MHCPFCANEETKVIDSRLAGEGRQIRRRRQCLDCNERFTTFETAELVMPRLVKNDSSRQPFDEDKLRYSMVRALEKRPVPSEALEQAIGRLVHKLRTMGEREVPSRLVGELVMEELRALWTAREPVYSEARITIDTGAGNAEEIAEAIEARLAASI